MKAGLRCIAALRSAGYSPSFRRSFLSFSFLQPLSLLRDSLPIISPALWTEAVMAEVRDDKAPHVVPFILERLAVHQQQHKNSPPADRPPFFIGLNGVQGAGKTVLVSILQETLQNPPHNLPTVVFSLDDLYLTHEDQEKLAEAHPDNPLLQHRGQPSTHDIPLARSVFRSLKQKRQTAIPEYDKARFDGQGERVADHEWKVVNKDPAVRCTRGEYGRTNQHSISSKWSSSKAGASGSDHLSQPS